MTRERLKNTVTAESQWAIGCMSGTSLDGVDAAEVKTDGERILAFGQTEYRAYTPNERTLLRSALGHWPGSPAAELAGGVVTKAHLEVLRRFNRDAVVGFHGQTLAHDPSRARTHQVGSAAALAATTGRRIVWDFRTEDMRQSGQGAPLAPFYHFALAVRFELTEPVLFLNLGGVANVTWVNPRFSAPEEPGALVAFDTGPANGPINDLLYAREGMEYDCDGERARAGAIDEGVAAKFLQDPYFDRPPPKSLDRDHFSDLSQRVGNLRTADAAATLTACAARAAALGLPHLPQTPVLAIVCGGGRRNPVFMEMLRDALALRTVAIEEFGVNGDMLEAQAFGYLASRVLCGLPTSCPATTGCAAPVSGGRIAG